jgi:predicted DNA-binding protein
MYNPYIVRRTQIYIGDEQDRRLAIRAAGSGVTKSSVIRRAIDRYLGEGEEEATRLLRFRQAVRAVAGALSELDDGARYVERLRQADRVRQADLQKRSRA